MLTKQTPRVDVTYVVGALPLASRKHAARGPGAVSKSPMGRLARRRGGGARRGRHVGGAHAALGCDRDSTATR